MGSQLTLQVLARHHPRLHMHSVAALSSHPVSRRRHPSVTASSQRRLWQAIILACPHGQGFSCRVLRSSWSGRGLLPSSHDRSWMDGHHPHPWRHGLLPASHVRSWPAIINSQLSWRRTDEHDNNQHANMIIISIQTQLNNHKVFAMANGKPCQSGWRWHP